MKSLGYMIFSILLFVFSTAHSYGQDSTATQLKSDSSDFLKRNHLTLQIYTEIYYSFDLSNPSNHSRQPFFYSFNRHNELNLNLGLIKLAYAHNRTRANVGLMAGTYAVENLQNEPGLFRFIYEANVGYKLSAKKELWLDAGVLPSHLGFESAIGSDCWNVTRSILAENSPYFESGVRLSYTTPNQKWYWSALFLNGWQQIYRNNGNNSPGFGHQIQFKPNAKLLINSGSFIGNVNPDSLRKFRYFHNFYMQAALHKKWDALVDFDFGIQQKEKGGATYSTWFSPAILVRFKPTDKIGLAARAEYYSDLENVIIPNAIPGFSTYGYSLNFDYKLDELVLWRIEARILLSEKAIYILNNQTSKQNYFLTSSLIFKFN